MALAKDLKELLASFVAHRVEFLVAGAHAMALYGKPRYTGALDLFVRRSAENAQKILGALNEFGFAGLGIGAEDLMAPDDVLQLGVEPNRVDILTDLTGVNVDEAWREREDGKLDGVSVSFLSRNCLIVNKRSTGRKQDLADLESLDA